MERGQFTFYRSYWEAIKGLKKKEDRLSALEAICAYALDEEERPMTDVASGMFILHLTRQRKKQKEARSELQTERKDSGKISER